ncbi:dTDP-4-dehydrorhamnose reductase [Acinetobacter chinensis]|jgi:dTDP-4-dehydrorhamnose reductase|uniref:dTDP-4-dehydrorhamnose reductase n=1 Tax=Acinetobacter chinensis TaxID=2004650 RepID=UPI0029352707|nr:dTDP-4-dehydrorhamnose reductase [Acinetobacter chinensis]WOE42128.1 dTDP-4-dehydrorhamnose reductase [Acinetobacter chinensis]
MKIVLLGKNGQVGWELQRALAPLGEVIALDRHGESGLSGDMTQPEKVCETLIRLNPDIVVNATAYTAVDQAESDQETAQLVNTDAVASIADSCRQMGALLIHYSTDYVFNGQGTEPFSESDSIAPLNVYGLTKAAGEKAIIESGCKYLIFRTSWVYARQGKNFLKTMLNLAAQREELSVIDDQHGAPTSAELIADVTAQIIPQVCIGDEKLGVYHLVASGETTWYGYAQYIFEQAKSVGHTLKIQNVKPIPSSEYPVPAVRPHNSRLNNQKIQQTFNLNLAEWQAGVKRTLMELLNT